MKITVILCTYNRCQSLVRALDSLAASILSETIEWEVLVVDNNSSDQTKAIVEDFCRQYPGRFRYLFEPQQGKSYALNAGIREARGDILAFVDDDVTVEPMWLQNLRRLCATANGPAQEAAPSLRPGYAVLYLPAGLHSMVPVVFFARFVPTVTPAIYPANSKTLLGGQRRLPQRNV